MVQEAVTNALPHSTGSHLQIRVDVDAGGTVNVLVGDDGHNPRGTGTRTGHGLRGMRERAQEVGGTCEVSAGPDGWRVIASIPNGDSA